MALYPQVMIYNYMKLQVLRAKAAMSTSKDEEKRSGGEALSQGASLDAEPLLAEEASASVPTHAANGYTNFQYVPTPASVPCCCIQHKSFEAHQDFVLDVIRVSA